MFHCPITHQIFLSPVVGGDGFTYEEKAYKKWIKKHNTSPTTGLPMTDLKCIKSFYITKAVESYLEENPHLKNEQYQEEFDIDELNDESCNAIEYLTKFEGYQLPYDKIKNRLYENNEIMKYIIDNATDLEYINRKNLKLIHYVCKKSTPTTIKYLIDKNVDLEHTTNAKMRPIHYICKYSTLEVLKYIVSKNVKIDRSVIHTILDKRMRREKTDYISALFPE